MQVICHVVATRWHLIHIYRSRLTLVKKCCYFCLVRSSQTNACPCSVFPHLYIIRFIFLVLSFVYFLLVVLVVKLVIVLNSIFIIFLLNFDKKTYITQIWSP